jgi:hypothetical protein
MATATKIKKKKKRRSLLWKAGSSRGHTTNLKQSILRLSISMVTLDCAADILTAADILSSVPDFYI